MNRIIPIERIIGYGVSKAVSGFQYHYGNWNELNNYLKVGKGKEQMQAFGQSFEQYPLIWLVKPFMTQKLPDGDFYKVDRMRLILAVNNQQISELNTDREARSFSILEPIANDILEHLTKSSIVYFPNRKKPEYGFDKVPNYPVNDKSAGIDIWDTIVLEMPVIVDAKCLEFSDFNCDYNELLTLKN